MGIQTNDQKVLKYDFFDNCRYYLKKKSNKKKVLKHYQLKEDNTSRYIK